MVGGVRCSRIMNISDLRPAAGGVPEHGDDFLAHVLYARRVARGERVQHHARQQEQHDARVVLEYARRAHSENRRVRARRLGRQRAAPRVQPLSKRGAARRALPTAAAARGATTGRASGSTWTSNREREARGSPREAKARTPHPPGRRPRANARVRQTLNPDLKRNPPRRCRGRPRRAPTPGGTARARESPARQSPPRPASPRPPRRAWCARRARTVARAPALVQRRPRKASPWTPEAGPRAPGRSRRVRPGTPRRAAACEAKPPCGFPRRNTAEAPRCTAQPPPRSSRGLGFPRNPRGRRTSRPRARRPGGSTLTPSATRRSRAARKPPPGPRAARAGARPARWRAPPATRPPGRLSARGGARRAASRPALRARRRWRAPAARTPGASAGAPKCRS